MIKHYCEKCGKEIRKWLVCTVETDTDFDPMDTIPCEEVDKMQNLTGEYEICYDCMAKFVKPKNNKGVLFPDKNSIVMHAGALKRRFRYDSRRNSTPSHYDNTEEE